MYERETEMAVKRLDRFLERVTRQVLAEKQPLTATCGWSSEPVPFERRDTLTFKPVAAGEQWGKAWESAWFHLQGTVPAAWSGCPVVAQIDLSGEGLVLSSDGVIRQGISPGAVFQWDFNRDLVRLYEPCQGGERVELWVEAAANALFGVFTKPDPERDDPDRHGSLDAIVKELNLCRFDEEHWQLWLDLRLLRGMLQELPTGSVRYARIVRTVSEAINAYAVETEPAAACREMLSTALTTPAAASDLRVTAVGHAHIDSAWLWPVRETIRKCARTFANQLELIDRYPEYVFGASQPQHYLFIKEHYPALYDRIKAAVAAGRWEPQGGMWVEADCNITGGESLVRQILHGKNFFRDEFGVEVDNLWLPDVFGYSAALPQIMRRSGLEYFLTQKLSWNQLNRFPHHTFQWRGIDGSEVLAHFPPEDNYNSMLEASSLIAARERFQERDRLDEFLSLFGVGDGGGGPKEENIEWGIRQRDLEGTPQVRFGTAREFFHRLREQADRLDSWSGELYFELHRGTLTSQALVKRMNRRLEHRLRAVEFLWSCLPPAEYPRERLTDAWRLLMLNQFHDILPGSSINLVYRDTYADHREVDQLCDTLEREAAPRLFHEDAGKLVLFNSLSNTYRGVVELPETWREAGLQTEAGEPLPVQKETEHTTALVEVPPLTYLTLECGGQPPMDATAVEPDLQLENDLVRYRFDEQGVLLEAYDKELEREILATAGQGNRLALYEDRPNDWDAWDVDSAYRDCLVDTAHSLAAEAICAGPVRAGLRFRLLIGASTVTQEVYLARDSRRLDFVTRVDWRERHRLLRTSFPVAVASERATCDIQYGFLERDTHANTSWERARFEVAAHRYVDLSDNDYGVALLNDCKYGHYLRGNLLDLALLRAPTNPDPDADQGEHEFTYALLPHTGDLRHSDVIQEAARLNQGVLMFPGWSAAGRRFPVELKGKGLSLEVCKLAEKEECRILRIVETSGDRAEGSLSCAGAELIETDLMEWEEGESHSCSEPVPLALNRFELRTLKLRGGE